MQFTTVRSKEKDYDIYLKSETLIHRNQEHENNVSKLFGIGKKTWFLAISGLKTMLQLFGDRKKWIPAICRLKNVVRNCWSKEKDYNIYFMSKNWFTAINSTKKMFPSYL